MKFRTRSKTGGAGKVEWMPTPQAADKARSVPFQIAAGDWQDVAVELPAEGVRGIIRLYLPAQKDPLQLDWIELNHTQDKSRRWEF